MEFASLKTIAKDVRNGEMFVILDDVDRENEGDVVMAAEHITTKHVNFMLDHCRGIICISITSERAKELDLKLQRQRPEGIDRCKFLESVDAMNGITTGTSAQDRASAISVIANPKKGYDDIQTPGHVFPVLANDMGVLGRRGHTEASVDIMRVSGLQPAAVICEIMNKDGTMSKPGDVEKFCIIHDLNIVKMQDIYDHMYENKKEYFSE